VREQKGGNRGYCIQSEQALDNLICALIVQASIDYAESRVSGFVGADNVVLDDAIRQRLQERYPSRTPLPKWLEPCDIHSCVWFLFYSPALDDLIPAKWEVEPSAIRAAIRRAVQSGASLSRYFFGQEREEGSTVWEE